ncbi:MAG: ribosome biogenesis GTPase Der [Bdellovibrionales bacterium]|nr:ribosome biogenesis GTPase Der [Bdellovibrionales bacterium]
MNIVVVGRPNVGKSSLFNRLLGRKRALVLDTPGVTRDRIVEPAEFWVRAKKYPVNLIDTGGLGEGQFKEEIKLQVKTALKEADIVLFVVDIKAGLTESDRSVFQELRRSGLADSIPVILVLNKADSDAAEESMHEFYELGIESLLPVSAEHALQIDDLKEMIVDRLFVDQEEEEDADENAGFVEESDSASEVDANRPPRIPHIAIVGQPNVGKSTLLNSICGEKRTIVSPIAGTTVDPIDLKINWHGKDFVVIDTAGIRRKNKTEQGVEVLSVVQTRKTLERADLAFLVMDGETGVYDQDEKIAGLIEEMGCSVVLVLNKWDTQVENDEFSQKLAEEEVRKKIRFLGYAPLVFTTATEGIGLERLFRVADHVLEQRGVRVPTKDLTEFIRAESEVHNPENARFYFVHQSGRNPPTFVAHVSDPKKIHFSLSRHLVRALRERYGFTGSPIRFHFLKTRNTGEKK